MYLQNTLCQTYHTIISLKVSLLFMNTTMLYLLILYDQNAFKMQRMGVLSYGSRDMDPLAGIQFSLQLY